MSGEKRAGNKRNKGKTAVWVILGLMLMVIVGIVFAYIKLESLNKTSAEFVEKPEIVLETEAELPVIVETPADIDEDFLLPVETPVEESIYKQVRIDEDVFNVLVLGSDVRPHESGYGRSDSMMLVSFDRENKVIKISSFMRDTWISIPNKGWNRINAAYAFGGIGLAVNTVNENFGLDIQNYAIVEFDGLLNLVDDLGGIEVYLTLLEIKYINSANLGNPILAKTGRYLLNGAQTLTHSRNRSTGDGDFGRTRRQRDVLVAIMEKMYSTMNPITLTSFITESLDYVDTNISPDTVFTLGLDLISAKKYTVQQARVPFDDTWQYASKEGRSVVTINLERNKSLLHEFLYGEK